MRGSPNPTSPDAPGSAPAGAAEAAKAATSRRAVIWAAEETPAGLASLLRARGLEPEPVASAPAAILAALRGPTPAAALILVEPARLWRACEAVASLIQHAPAVGCWRFEPPPAGPDGAGKLERVEGTLRLDLPARFESSGDADDADPPAAERGRARLSREELAMLLGPTRRLSPAAGDAS